MIILSDNSTEGGPSGSPFPHLLFDFNRLPEYAVDELVSIYGEGEMQEFFEFIYSQECMDPQGQINNLINTLIFDRHIHLAYMVVRSAAVINLKGKL